MLRTLLTLAVSCVIIATCVALYLLPVIIGAVRKVPDIGAIAVIDILLGWTFVGWVVALALAFRTVRSAVPVVQVVQNVPPSPLPPGQVGAGGWAGPPREPPTGGGGGGPGELPPAGSSAGDDCRVGPSDDLPATWAGWSADRPAGWAGSPGPPPPRHDSPPPLVLPHPTAGPADLPEGG